MGKENLVPGVDFKVQRRMNAKEFDAEWMDKLDRGPSGGGGQGSCGGGSGSGPGGNCHGSCNGCKGAKER